MIVVLVVRHSVFGVEEVIAGDELKDHASKRPYVGRLVILSFKDDFGWAVLSGLDDVWIVSIGVTRITHVYNLDVEHHIANILEISPSLRVQLHIHSLLAGSFAFTADTHTIIDFLLQLFTKVFESYLISVGFRSKFGEIVWSVLFHELQILVSWVRENYMGVTIFALI